MYIYYNKNFFLCQILFNKIFLTGNLNNNLDQISTATQTGTKSISAYHSGVITSIYLSPGVYVVEGRIRYDDSLTGRRFIGINSEQGISTTTTHTLSVYKDTALSTLTITCVLYVNTGKTYYLLGFSDNATTATDGYIHAMKIK